MQYDVLASKPLASDGQFVDQSDNNILRARVKAVYIVPSGTAGSVVFKDGGSSGQTRLTLATTTDTGIITMWMPGEGILFDTNIYGDLTNVTSVTIIYG
jgi:hypothetical protein